MPKKTTSTQKGGLTTAQAKELVEVIVARALQAQARELEKHLLDIHERLALLEQRK